MYGSFFWNRPAWTQAAADYAAGRNHVRPQFKDKAQEEVACALRSHIFRNLVKAQDPRALAFPEWNTDTPAARIAIPEQLGVSHLLTIAPTASERVLEDA